MDINIRIENKHLKEIENLLEEYKEKNIKSFNESQLKAFKELEKKDPIHKLVEEFKEKIKLESDLDLTDKILVFIGEVTGDFGTTKSYRTLFTKQESVNIFKEIHKKADEVEEEITQKIKNSISEVNSCKDYNEAINILIKYEIIERRIKYYGRKNFSRY